MWQSIKDKFYCSLFLMVPVMVVLCLFIPITAGILSGLANPWQLLPLPPSRPEKLLGTGNFSWKNFKLTYLSDYVDENGQMQENLGHSYILAENGQVYAFDLVNQIWREAQQRNVYNRNDCKEGTGSFFYPENGQCVQQEKWHTIGFYTTLEAGYCFLLDQDGFL